MDPNSQRGHEISHTVWIGKTVVFLHSAGILEQSIGARLHVGIGLSYWPAGLRSYAQFLASIDFIKILARSRRPSHSL